MPRPTSPTTKADAWRRHFADFDRSELTVAQFCQRIGCSVPTFYQWKRKLSSPQDQSAFLRVRTTDPASSVIEISLPSGVSIRVPLSAVSSLADILEQVA